MPPFLPIQALRPRQLEGEIAATGTPYNNDGNEPDAHGSSVIWIVPVAVASVIILTAFLVCAIAGCPSRRAYQKAREKDPYLTRPEFAKKRKMSTAERAEEEEKQRIIMIRKSLASRSWGSGSVGDSAGDSRRTSRFSEASHASQVRMAIPEEDEDGEPKPLKEDWKAYEARMQGTVSLGRHPSMSVDRHMATGETPDLTMPRPSRSRSPSRSPLLNQLPSTPKLPPQDFGRAPP